VPARGSAHPGGSPGVGTAADAHEHVHRSGLPSTTAGQTCQASVAAPLFTGTRSRGRGLPPSPPPSPTRRQLRVAAREIRRRRTLLQCQRRRLQHAKIVRARANHLARLAGDRGIRGECRRSDQREGTCGPRPQASRRPPMNSAVTPGPATVSRIYFISGSDRPSSPSIERKHGPAC
jgi:hypothetical protein